MINLLKEATLCQACGIYFDEAYCPDCGYYPLPEKNFNKMKTEVPNNGRRRLG